MFDKYDEIKSAALVFGEKVSKKLRLKLRLNEAIFQEAIISARVSCSFHGKGEANHIKQVSHIAFWIIKLKPFSLVKSNGEKARNTLMLTELWAVLDSAHKDDRRKALETEINEMIAMTLANHLIAKGFADIEKKIEEKGDRYGFSDHAERVAAINEMNTRLKANQARMELILHEIVRSFREHNYTSRALATMLHLAYSTGHESLHEEATA